MSEKLSDITICEKCGHRNKNDVTHCTHCGNEMYRDYYKGLWLRNTIITFILFLVPFFILFFIINVEIGKHFENQVMHGLDYSVDMNVRIVKSFLDERKQDLLSVTTLDITRFTEIQNKKSFFDSYLAENPWFDFIAVADLQGNVAFSTNDLQANIAHKGYFKEASQGQFVTSSLFYSEILDTIAMLVSSPLFNQNNKMIGVIFASLSLETFYDLMVDLRIGETSEVFLVDERGLFLSPSRLGGEVLKEYGHFKDEENPHTGRRGIITHLDYRGEKVLCAYRKFDDLNWYLVSEMDVAEARAPITKLKNVLFTTFFIFGCFLLLSSVLFSRRMTQVLKNLTRNLKTTLDDLSKKKNTINTINRELRDRLHECEALGTQIRVSEEYIKNIIDSISSGLIAINKSKAITYCNDFTRHLTRRKSIKMLSNIYTVFPILGEKEIRSSINRLISEEKGFRIRKIAAKMDTRTIMLSIAGFPISDGKEIVGATLLINDITEQEQFHAQMADYEKLSALSQLALGAAHEINNPLLGITSYIELLLEEEEGVEDKTRAKEVLNNAYRISETVRGLLDFARPTPPKFTKISLNKLIIETLSFLNHQPLFRKIKISKTLSDTVPQITADVNQIRQVLINIFINAAQAMPDAGTLTIITTKVKFEELVEIRIIDTGIGISSSNIKRIFEPFFTTKKGKGTGLGLSISYSYVKNHSGEIDMRSEINKGTEVIIRLPIRQEGKIQSEVIE